MLSGMNGKTSWLINIVLIFFWHFAVLMISIYANKSIFNPSNRVYRTHKWEKNGAFYIKVLKIKKWKDKLPQFVLKGGFSKKNLEKNAFNNGKYIQDFMLETCRGEWNHLMGCMYSVISIFLNPPAYAILFSIIVMVCNAPFIAIQRYNRIRLKRIHKREEN